MIREEKKHKYCLLCQREVEEIVDLSGDRYKHIRDRVKKVNPRWEGKDGACGKCLAFYEKHE